MEDKKDDKPASIVDEARVIRDEILKAKEELKAEKEAMERLQSNELLSGTAGKHIEPVPPKQETPKDYANKILSGGLNGPRKED